MVVQPLRRILAALAVLAGLAAATGVPAIAVAAGDTATAAVFQAPYALP